MADRRRVKSSSASHSATGLQPVIPRLQTAKRIAVRESDARGKIYFDLWSRADSLTPLKPPENGWCLLPARLRAILRCGVCGPKYRRHTTRERGMGERSPSSPDRFLILPPPTRGTRAKRRIVRAAATI
jgi:hypothetical protein